MKVSVIAICLAVLSLLPLASIHLLGKADAAEQYPANHLIHDYEPSADEQWDLDVAMGPDDNFFAVWADERLLFTDIRFSKSIDGSSWGDGLVNNNDVIVNDDSGQGADHNHPSITVDSKGRLYSIWLDSRGGEWHVRLATSNNSGSLWTPSRKVEAITGTVSEPFVRWSRSAGLCIVYVEERQRVPGGPAQKDIMFVRSMDEGFTFSAPKRINDDATDQDQFHPRASISPTGAVGIVWQDYREGDSSTGAGSRIYLSVTKNGVDFRGNFRAGSDTSGERMEEPDLSFSSNDDMMIAWQQSSLNGWRVRYSMAWAASPRWDGNMSADHQITPENISRLNQFKPRVGYVGGSFSLAWTELDIRDFYLVRLGYVSRSGEYLSGDHIVDNTIAEGRFVKDPDIFVAEMFKDTVAVIGRSGLPQIFWLDFRTDYNPSNDINEDGDPYTARALPPAGMPLLPMRPQLKAREISWDRATIEWTFSQDVEFKGYYLTYGLETAPTPDENINNFSSTDRFVTKASLSGLASDRNYEVRLMIKDRMGNSVLCQPIHFNTQRNHPPTFSFIEPDGTGDECDQQFTLRWEASDMEEVASYTLYYDTDLSPEGQVQIFEGTTAEGAGELELPWNTSSLPDGGYTINATIIDGVNPPVTVYSPAIIVSHMKEVIDHPRVSSVTVEGGKESAYIDSIISVMFTKDMAPTSLDSDTLYVLDPGRSKVEGTITLAGTTGIEWRPKGRLAFGSIYRLVATPMVKDIEGNPLDGKGVGASSVFETSFTTRPDTGVPQVRSWAPQGSGSPLWPSISVRFDIPMAEGTLNNLTVKLFENGRSVPLIVSYAPLTLEMKAGTKRPLGPNSTFRVELSRAVTSLKGKGLEGAFNWSFTTGAPDLSIDRDNDDTPDDLDWFPDDPAESLDTDQDGRGNNIDLDDDGDTMSDAWEEKYGLDPFDPNDALEDPDGDGKTNLEEFIDGTDPTKKQEGVDYQTALFILLGIGAVIVAVLLIYAVLQRRRLERERLERSFFREE